MSRLLYAICVCLFLVSLAPAQERRPTVSVVDFGDTEAGKRAAETLRERFRASGRVQVADADLTRSAAMGAGYAGSLNLNVRVARDLGAALATEYFVLGDAQTLRRSSSTSPVYYESYCSVFLVSSRTGLLVHWDRPSFENNDASQAEALLAQKLSQELYYSFLIAIARAHEDDLRQRTVIVSFAGPVIEEAPADEKAAEARGLRLPRPYKRLRPEYPESAARAEAEATVDVLADIGADGEVGAVYVVRWAGFGLDEATVATVRQMHFFPAMRNGTAIPMSVLLRYNFRKPPR
jgi:TonB family protein